MEKFIHGMDISSMDEVVGLGGKYYDKGEERELTDILKSYGVNYIRLRLWLNPYTQEGASYGAGANDLNTTLRMIKRVKAAGFKYLLDFHYSDFWTDPGKQIKPKIWKDYGPAELEVALYEYTKETLLGLKAEGCRTWSKWEMRLPTESSGPKGRYRNLNSLPGSSVPEYGGYAR